MLQPDVVEPLVARQFRAFEDDLRHRPGADRVQGGEDRRGIAFLHRAQDHDRHLYVEVVHDGRRFLGLHVLVERDQPTAYPRKNLELEGWNWSSDEIPRQVISAQLALCLEINAGADPYNPPDALPVVRKRVEGAVEVEYANPSKVSKVSKYQPSQTIINVLLKNNGLSAVQPVGIRA